jgi:hypothetical protein
MNIHVPIPTLRAAAREDSAVTYLCTELWSMPKFWRWVTNPYARTTHKVDSVRLAPKPPSRRPTPR